MKLSRIASSLSTRALTLVTTAVLLGLASSAVAQDAAAAPQPTLTRSPSVLLGYGLIFVLLVIVVAISFMPSKRGHQD